MDSRIKENDNIEKVSKEKIKKKKNKKVKTEQKGFWGKNWSWLLSTGMTLVFMIALMIYNKVTPFGMSSFTLVDSIHQYVPFFSDYRDKLLSGSSLAYTWDVGMGQNFQSLLLYYMASPLNLIIVFFTRKGIITMMSCLIALKIVISSGTFAFFLSRRGGKITNNFLITALSLGYALNTYMCGYFWNLMWLDCIMIFPLIILGYENLIERKDPRLYIFALFYSMYCNYYISFIICIFLCLWFIVTGHRNFKGFILDGLKFAGCSLLAAGMAAISLFMAYLAIMKTASAGTAMPEWSWYQNFFDLLKNHLFLTKPKTMDVFDGEANLYCGTFTYMMLFVYICSNKIKLAEKIRKLLLIAFFIISMNQELLNFIWHGFHNQYGIPNRFAFLYIFVLLVIAYEAVSRIKKTNVIALAVGIILSSSFIAVLYHQVAFDGLLDDMKIMVISYLMIVVYAIFLMLRCGRIIPDWITTSAIALIFAAEIMVNAWAGITTNGLCDGEYYMEYSEEMEDVVGEIDSRAAKANNLFYRSDIVDPIMLDENTYDNMKSIGTFCSTVRGDMVSTMAYMGYYTGANEYLYNGSSLMTNDLFGVRYVYMRDGDYYPAKNDYKLVFDDGETFVYENTNALPLGYAVSDKIYDWEYWYYNSGAVLNDFAKLGVDCDDIYEDVDPYFIVSGTNCMADYNSNSPDIISYNGGSGDTITIVATFYVEEKGRYFLNCRANYLEEIKLEINDEYKTSGRYQTQMFDTGELNVGDKVTYTLEFNSNYSPEGTVSMYMSKLNRDNLTKLRASLLKNAFKISKITDSTIEGTISMKEDELLCLAMPYDEGWKIYVDGEPYEGEEWAGGLMAISIPEGMHKVYMKFVPDGFVLGLVITILCWMIYIVLWMIIIGKIQLPKLARGKKVASEDSEKESEEGDSIEETEELSESKKMTQEKPHRKPVSMSKRIAELKSQDEQDETE